MVTLSKIKKCKINSIKVQNYNHNDILLKQKTSSNKAINFKFMKNDSCHYFCLMRKYNEVLSSKKKKELFDIIKNNKHTYEDLKNILIENIILKMVSHGNLVDLRMLKKI